MPTLFKEVNYNLQTLINNIDIGMIGLPDIQRPFVWGDSQVRDLFDSMYRGYPVGYLLFWANSMSENVRMISQEGQQRHAGLLIVDGQQRLTSLYAVVKGVEIIRENFIKERIIIAFNPLEEKFVVPDAATRRSPEYVQDISLLWSDKVSPFDFVENFITNLKSKRDISDTEDRKIKDSIGRLHSLQSYPFSALELSAEISEEQVADVFVRINSEGKKLNNSDFILTIMSVFWEEGRTQLEDFCRRAQAPSEGEASAYNHFINPEPDQLLRVGVGLAFHRARLQYVYNILRGKDLDTGEFSAERRTEQFRKLADSQNKVLNLTDWHEFFKAVQSAGYLSGEMISSKNTLLYSYVLFLIGKYEYSVDHYRLRKIIAKWFMMCSLKGRYTGSPETIMESDLVRLRSINSGDEFVNMLENIIASELTDDYWTTTLITDLSTSSPRSPSLSAYYAALNLLDAPGLFSNLKVNELLKAGIRSKKVPLERHHLFPKAYLLRLGIVAQQDTNQIANYALVEWGDNIDISDKKPSDYVGIYKNRFSPDEIAHMYKLHGLPENWEEMDYREFLEKRRFMLAEVIREAYEKISRTNEA